MEGELIRCASKGLTAGQYCDLAAVSPELEWLVTPTNLRTKATYQQAGPVGFHGLYQPHPVGKVEY